MASNVPPLEQETLPISGMTCANCALTIERNVRKLEGVLQAEVNLARERLFIAYDPRLVTHEAIVARVRKAGYDVPEQAAGESLEDAEAKARQAEIAHQRRRLLIGALFTVPLFALSMGRDLGVLGDWAWQDWMNFLFWALATPVQFYVGRDYYIGAWRALRGGVPNMDVLVALGTSVAYFYSAALTILLITPLAAELHSLNAHHVYFETAAVIITLVVLGKLLEVRAKGQTGQAIRALIGLRAKTARVERHGVQADIPIEEVRVGDVLIVRESERIPTDGVIIEGTTSVDQSMLTGESLPVLRTVGDEVIGGTLNRQGLIKMRATRVGRETALAQIIKLVESAQGSRAPIQRLVDQVSAVFVPVVIGIAALTFTLWLLSGAGLATALLRMVAVLVIACPCAMGLATPTAITVGVGKGAALGILFKNSAALEQLLRVDAFVLDKTGTLTRGAPTVTDVVLSAAWPGTRQKALQLAASAERGSQHPLGEALVRAAEAESVPLYPPRAFESFPGQGVRAEVDGQMVSVGSQAFMQAQGIQLDGLRAEAARLQAEAKTALWLAIDGQAVALIAAADTLKEGSAEAVQALRALGKQVIMLTGDNEVTARAIAAQVGIDRVMANVLPSEKAAVVRALQAEGLRVAMVGDGVNDSPALAQADVGIAIGTGTDVAIEAADVTLMRGDLRSLPQAVHLSQLTMRTIRQNLLWAFGYNVALIPVAGGALAVLPNVPEGLAQLNPMLAALAMAFSSVSVVTNSLRLRSKRL
ncbi:MAG: copper-translocating P-type ATPase [Chloroflexota bacterium]|nr:MAG: copper-translocating P-type ATPase [Chloroflexota bacterium]